MPPPTSVDAWLASRRFGVVIDAGSSGSRLQIYSWKDARTVRMEQGADALRNLPQVRKGTEKGEEWSVKVEPGLSTFADNTEGVPTYLAPLLEHARSHIPPSMQPETPLFLLATAGMRLLSSEKQAEVLQSTCDFLRLHSHFKIESPSSVGPCGSSVRIITGEEEGLFGWIAVNYLMDGFGGPNDNPLTYGFLDMGGASTQIAFEPSKEEQTRAQNLMDVRLRLLNGNDIQHKVFVTTWLGYGTNQARERYVAKLINDYEANRDASNAPEYIEDPCLPKDLTLTNTPLQPDGASTHSKRPHKFIGTGNWEQCLSKSHPLLNKDAPCPDSHCLFNGVYVPPIDFSASHFIGVSEYWYSTEQSFRLGGAYDVVQYERAASDFCAQDWTHILEEHTNARNKGHLGGDGEVEQDGVIVETGKWGPDVEIPRLQLQCFKAAWIVNVLHEGIGMPRIVDAGGNGTTSGDKVAAQAQNKGLGRPSFQSMDTVGDIAISWTLGKMVLEASREVAPASALARPIVDPIDDIPDLASSPVKPIRPFLDFDAVEDKIIHHLPHSFTRHSLGFSPVGFVFYLSVCAFCVATFWRMRHRIRSTVRRFVSKRDRPSIAEGYMLEEGLALASSRPASPRHSAIFPPSIQRIASSLSARTGRPSPLSVGRDAPRRPGQHSPGLVTRSYSYPTMKSSGSGGNGNAALAAPDEPNGTATAYVPSSPRLPDGTMMSNGSLSSLQSRSRNSSHISLSSLAPRQAVGRTGLGAAYHAPAASYYDE
ncbi:nucleoside phosphatase family-domain-containing protein [Epithele typhae]|uniref:nucleoside phosphatase family-domain-containing protein n=1 Tax=Epithele typhae TaxID=378194 RepID=UPI00200815DE|nr:nucleoside phosphatase family-domain-containing protein [Epithele typhae]KAH9931692.1 nucleoside phosphatase family-domain-containing protein [Epithele typhae]